jgi:hypothetical protein
MRRRVLHTMNGVPNSAKERLITKFKTRHELVRSSNMAAKKVARGHEDNMAFGTLVPCITLYPVVAEHRLQP